MEPLVSRRRHRAMRAAGAILLLAVAMLAAGCGGAGQGSAAPAAGEVRTGEEAAAAVAARSPIFDGIGPKDPNLIGQAASWTATPLDGSVPPAGWTVTFEIGWGDCPSGCIDRHTWTWQVDRDGTVSFEGEAGSPLTDQVLGERLDAAKVTGVGGRVLAGPVCPVERPGDSACAPRTVPDAVLVVKALDGREVARFTTDGSGLYRVSLAPGEYTLEANPVEGFMGTPGPLPFMVKDGAQTALDVAYDTGIR